MWLWHTTCACVLPLRQMHMKQSSLLVSLWLRRDSARICMLVYMLDEECSGPGSMPAQRGEVPGHQMWETACSLRSVWP